ncbi:MAG: transglycosylase SLT domain-containing protein [Desulfosarcinaceae bacterium]
MKMILAKIPVPIQVSAVLLSFFLFAACTAVYLNTPSAALAVLPAPIAIEITEPPVKAEPSGKAEPSVEVSVKAETAVTSKSTVRLRKPVPGEVDLLPDLAQVRPVGDAVCRDPESGDEVDRILAEATEETPPLEKGEPESEPQQPEPPFHSLILQAAMAHDVEPALIKAVILAESNYNPKAISKRGARGLMQLMPSTAAALGVTDLFDPEDNINGGVKYLRQLLDRFNNDVRLALAAYNAGSRYVRRYKGVPPFRSTRLYIKKVFKYQALFEEEMAANRQTV